MHDLNVINYNGVTGGKTMLRGHSLQKGYSVTRSPIQERDFEVAWCIYSASRVAITPPDHEPWKWLPSAGVFKYPRSRRCRVRSGQRNALYSAIVLQTLLFSCKRECWLSIAMNRYPTRLFAMKQRMVLTPANEFGCNFIVSICNSLKCESTALRWRQPATSILHENPWSMSGLKHV